MEIRDNSSLAYLPKLAYLIHCIFPLVSSESEEYPRNLDMTPQDFSCICCKADSHYTEPFLPCKGHMQMRPSTAWPAAAL
jgi:hypothetical protein